MKKFMVIYHAPMSAIEQVQDASPEEAKEAMEPWMAWAKNCRDGLVDLGTPLGGGQKVTRSGNSPSDRNVTGYSILQAENIEAAQAMVKGHPHLQWAEGCEVEVHEAFPLPWEA